MKAQNDTNSHASGRLLMAEVPSVHYPPCFLTICVLKGVGRENSFLRLYCEVLIVVKKNRSPTRLSDLFLLLGSTGGAFYRPNERLTRFIRRVHARSTLFVTFTKQAERKVPFFSRICCAAPGCSEEEIHDDYGNLRSTGLQSIEGN